MERILVTGASGFIGYHCSQALLARGCAVVGVDNLNDYYDIRLKRRRLDMLKENPGFRFVYADIEDLQAMKRIFIEEHLDAVLNLAARTGVRHSLLNPHIYLATNIQGTLNLLELARTCDVKKIVLASSSSLYGGENTPFKETADVGQPISPYAASKAAMELIAFPYHHLYDLDITILRFFTVYGPLGRPDMSVMRFISWIAEGQPIQIYGDGTQSRDFTYVDDIVDGVLRSFDPLGFEVFNLGCGSTPTTLLQMIAIIEQLSGKQAELSFSSANKADMTTTWADVGKARKTLGWEPRVSIEEGLRRTWTWYCDNRDWLQGIGL